MTKRIFSILTFLPMMLLLVGCSEMESIHINPSQEVKMTAFLPGTENTTRVDLSQPSNTLDLMTRWQNGDELLVYLLQDNEKYDVGKVSVTNISSDGKQASFSFTLPSGVSPGKNFYVYAFYNTNGNADKAYGSWDIFSHTDLIRTELSKFKAPLFGEAELNNKSSGTIKFRHFNTYEVLHLKNATNADISFCHFGFKTELPWYAVRAGINFEGSGDKVTLPSEWDADCESETISIPASNTVDIISCYLPSGYKMRDAYLQARINGTMVTSSNKKTSDVTIERAHAYHMYATWDGTNLTFDNGDAGILTVEPNPIEFGSVEAGTTATGVFTVSNTGNANISFEIQSMHTTIFDIPESGKSFTLKPDESLPFTITFSPEAETKDKPYSEMMTITTNASNGTQYITITGKSESREEVRLDQVIPEEIRNKMEEHIPIYDGANPPNIEGGYVISPCIMTFDSKGGYEYGHQFADSYIRFHNQDMVNNTLDYQEQQSSSQSIGTGCFISGEGDKFSIYFNTEGVTNYSEYDITFKTALIISGIKTDEGIQDLYYAFVMVDKSDDPKPYIMAVGDYRVIKDGDGISYPYSWASVKKRVSAKDWHLPGIMEVKRK